MLPFRSPAGNTSFTTMTSLTFEGQGDSEVRSAHTHKSSDLQDLMVLGSYFYFICAP